MSDIGTVQTIGAAEFKSRCLDILERLGNGQLERVIVTKRGRPVAELTPPRPKRVDVKALYGFMRGSVVIPHEIDLTDPILDETFGVESGDLHA